MAAPPSPSRRHSYMLSGPRNLEKGTGNARRARTGSVTGVTVVTVLEMVGGETGMVGIRTMTGVTVVTRTEMVIATTGSAENEVRKGNTVIVLMIVIATVTGAVILKGEETVTEMVTVGIVLAPGPLRRVVAVTADLGLVSALVQRASV
uniref:Splicing factor U2AF 65 kDa subunit n=1 Tax=Arundo donax TaxID=35708 RepID=A0A0A9EDA7_ARUDO